MEKGERKKRRSLSSQFERTLCRQRRPRRVVPTAAIGRSEAEPHQADESPSCSDAPSEKIELSLKLRRVVKSSTFFAMMISSRGE